MVWRSMVAIKVLMQHSRIAEHFACLNTSRIRTANVAVPKIKIVPMILLQVIKRVVANCGRARVFANWTVESHLWVDMLSVQVWKQVVRVHDHLPAPIPCAMKQRGIVTKLSEGLTWPLICQRIEHRAST